jgi:hypothetical protein
VNFSFENASKYFFWVAGTITALGALPTMVSPVGGFHFSTGLSYFDQSPQVFPIIGHWGIMVAGLGVLLFRSASNKQMRKTTVIYAVFEKAYLVGVALYCFLIHAPYARNYLAVVIVDGTLAIGGILYFLQSRKLGQA